MLHIWGMCVCSASSLSVRSSSLFGQKDYRLRPSGSHKKMVKDSE